MKVVKVKQQNQYAMPLLCCACGAPSGIQKLSVGKSVGFSGKRTVSLPFPLCDTCANANKTVKRRGNIGCITSLSLSILLFILAMVISTTLEVTPGTFLDNLTKVLIILSVFSLFGGFIITWILTTVGIDKGIRNTYKQTRKAVKMISYKRSFFGKGHIIFKFSNEQFAELFKQLNKDAVL